MRFYRLWPPTCLSNRIPKDGNCPHRGSGAAADLERHANKTEAPAADQLVQVDQVLIMGEAQLSADLVDFFVGDLAHAGRHGLDAESRDPLPAQPACRLAADAGAVRPILCPKCAAIVIRIQQHGIALPYLEPRGGEGAFQISRLDQLTQAFE